jgi:hypothetical protein
MGSHSIKYLMMSKGQELLPTPDMVGQANHHGQRALPIATPTRPSFQALSQGPMGTDPVVLEQTERHQCVPCPRLLVKGMRLTRQGVEPIAPYPIQALLVHRIRTRSRRSQHRTYRHAHNPPPSSLLDSLGQTHILPQHQTGTPPLPGPLRVTIQPPDGLLVGLPAITDPGKASLRSGRCAPCASRRNGDREDYPVMVLVPWFSMYNHHKKEWLP